MPYLFVGGSQRSGTTLLQKFLCMDALATPKLAEASYLRGLMQVYEQARKDFGHDTQSYFDSMQDLQQFHAGYIYQFLSRSLARFTQAEHLILKEPHLTLYFPLLYELVPDAKFVITMRDPRDTMASMIMVGERMKAQGQQHFFQERNIEYLSQYIKSFYAPSLQCTHEGFKNQLLVIRYEDLIRSTANVKQRLALFSGMSMEFDEQANPNMGGKDSDNTQTRYQPWLTDNNDKAINQSSIGKYKEVLSEAEIALANQHCNDLITFFQYQ